ncbi:MAG: FAD-binding protein [Chloroflexi bacterium]|nr:FAD-binding protein [Chloroflexota bacterium]
MPFYLLEGHPDHAYPAPGSRASGRNVQVRPFAAGSLGPWQSRLEFTPYQHGRITFEEMAAWGGRAGYRDWDHEVLAEREAKDIRTFGSGLAGHFVKAALDAGITFRTDARVDRLLAGERGVEGVVLASGERLLARKAVVLATGAYDANPRLMDWFDEFNSWPPIGAARNQGDGLVMAAEIGAAFMVMHWNLSLKLSYHVPGEQRDGLPLARSASAREVAYPHSLLVNRLGRRFGDEATFAQIAAKVREFDQSDHALNNVPCFLIFDSEYLDKYGLPPLPPGSAPPDWLARARTPAKLAGSLGVDPAGLSETIERFNRFAEAGVDEDFQRGGMAWSRSIAGDSRSANPNLGGLCRPPFFGLPMLPAGGNSVGLVTDESGRVLHLRGHHINGLFACGDVAAWMHVGVGFQQGTTLAGAMTFGWLAGRTATRS